MDINSLKERILELFLIENIENYKEYSIGDLLIRYKEPIIVEDDKEYKRVTVKNKNRGICLRDIEKGSKIKVKRQFIIKSKMFLMAKIGAGQGSFGIIPSYLNNSIITNDFCAYNLKQNILNINWINYYVSNRYFLEKCEKSSSGTGMRRINEKEFLNFKINLPSLEDQEIAVAKIEELFALIDILSDGKSSTLINIKNARDKILSLAIQGKLVEQDTNDTPASELLLNILEEKEKLIKEKKLKREKPLPPISEEEKAFDLPVGWEWCRLGDVAFITKLAGFEYTTYIQPNLNNIESVKLLKGKNIQNGKLLLNCEHCIPLNISEQLKRSSLTKKCLLTPFVGTLGNVAIFNENERYHLGSNVAKIEVFNNISIKLIEEYLLFYLKSTKGKSELLKHKKATAQDNISIKDIRNTFIIVPPLQEQHRIVAKIEELFSLLDIIENELI